MTIELPEQLDEENLVGFLSILSENKDFPESISFDFSTIRFARPFGALITAEAIRFFKAYRIKKGLKTIGLKVGILKPPFSDACSYLCHVGFFKHMDWDAGKDPGEAPGGISYLPITILKSIEFGVKLSSKRLALSIKNKSYQLSRIVFNAEDAQELLAYCFTEIIRNVFEHSGISRCSIMAQKYKGRIVEIAVIDSGCGIRNSLSKVFPGIDESTALKYAIQPGVSGSLSAFDSKDDVNSGFGLYVLSELGCLSGDFSLWSENHQLVIKKNQLKKVVERPFLNGTAVKIKVDTTNGEYFPNLLKDIVDKGEKEMPSYAKKQDGPSKNIQGFW